MLSKLQSEFGLSDKDGVADYHYAWWMNFVNKSLLVGMIMLIH
jgi:hypothetical protein